MACSGCASERFRVTVTDGDGMPVSNAVVSLGFSAGHIVFARGRSYDYETRTDARGKAEIKFKGKSSQFGWDVKADGYYRSGPHDETLKVEVTQVPPMFYTVTMLEHEKERTATLWKRINPQPMYSYRLSEAVDFTRKGPVKKGRYGFDLKLGAWLPPLGKGEVADFYYVRNIGEEPMSDGSVAWLEFDDGCGAYFGKQTGCKEFPSTYCANTNAVFRNRLPFMFVKKNSEDKRIDGCDCGLLIPFPASGGKLLPVTARTHKFFALGKSDHCATRVAVQASSRVALHVPGPTSRAASCDRFAARLRLGLPSLRSAHLRPA